jgi:hypothetical protein
MRWTGGNRKSAIVRRDIDSAHFRTSPSASNAEVTNIVSSQYSTQSPSKCPTATIIKLPMTSAGLEKFAYLMLDRIKLKLLSTRSPAAISMHLPLLHIKSGLRLETDFMSILDPEGMGWTRPFRLFTFRSCCFISHFCSALAKSSLCHFATPPHAIPRVAMGEASVLREYKTQWKCLGLR